MRDWSKIDKVVIFKGTDENGNRYLSQFLKDYQQLTGAKELNVGCGNCLEDYYKKYIQNFSTMSKKNKSGYVLKAKYDGIPLKFGSRTFVSNRNMTDQLAKELIKNHPKGEDLFDAIPEATTKKTEDTSTKDEGSKLSTLKRGELDIMASDLGLKPSDYNNKGEVIAAIESAQQAEEAAKNAE